ncbi:major royal jelly protein 4-like [Agrilus planipennis]|uniref:Major royal jelly protein 4-like n=1 Tax=Agrilus planipennis TaxID=224129 RepID=A0A1W4XGA8_AGRPL|nr:major royal jelly protein 4-like [Agrilus planipennis]
MRPKKHIGIIVSIVIVIVFLNYCNCWDLTSHDIKDNYYISSIAVFKNRAFLTLPRTSCFNNISYPTIIEVPWIGSRSVKVKKSIAFPPGIVQVWGVCDKLQDAVAVAVQEPETRLWVLDAGSAICNPKVIVYDLNFDVEFQKFQLVGIPHGTLTSLVIDENHEGGLVFVGSKNENTLVVLSLEESLWWEVSLRTEQGENVYTEALAISPIEPVLFATNSSKENLYKIKLESIVDNFRRKNLTRTAVADFIGNKMGPSGGMLVDLKGGLVYYLTRDYAVVRWDGSQSLKAESHDILAQSFRALPFVPCIFNGPQDGIWALVNPHAPSECPVKGEHPVNFTNTEEFKLRTRVIKLLKFIKKE